MIIFLQVASQAGIQYAQTNNYTDMQLTVGYVYSAAQVLLIHYMFFRFRRLANNVNNDSHLDQASMIGVGKTLSVIKEI